MAVPSLGELDGAEDASEDDEQAGDEDAGGERANVAPAGLRGGAEVKEGAEGEEDDHDDELEDDAGHCRGLSASSAWEEVTGAPMIQVPVLDGGPFVPETA
jgi:hypothetical protein